MQICIPNCKKRHFRLPKKHVLAIENVQFTFEDSHFGNQKCLFWQSRTLFVYQIRCSLLLLIQRVDQATPYAFLSLYIHLNLFITWFLWHGLGCNKSLLDHIWTFYSKIFSLIITQIATTGNDLTANNSVI